MLSKQRGITKTLRLFRYKLLIGACFAFSAFCLVVSYSSHIAWAATDSCTPPAMTFGTDTMSVNVPATSTYTLWTRLKIPSKSANSILLNVDHGSSCFDVGGNASLPLNTWEWVNYNDGSAAHAVRLTLGQGTHTFELIGTSNGVSVDRLEELTDRSCVPNGVGDNCAPINVASPTVQITSPASGAIVAGTVPVTATAASAPGVHQIGMKNVEFEVDGSPSAIDTASPYSMNLNTDGLTDGLHTIMAVATDTQGNQSSTTTTIQVANHGCSAGSTSPIDVTSTATSETTANLSWTASIPSMGCVIKDYTVYRGGSAIATTAATSFDDSSLMPNSIYSYSVSATDSSGHTSALSTPLQITTLADTTPPTSPGNVKATAKNSAEVKLSWTASTDNIAVGGYRVYRNGSLLVTLSNPNATMYQDNTTAANTAYSYQIAAYDTSLNMSLPSNVSPYPITTAKSTSSIPPNPPTGIRAVLETPTAIVLSWQKSTDSGGNVVGYRIYRNNTEVGSAPNSTSFTDTSLQPNTSYQYFVVAYDTSANVSSDSAVLTASTLSAPATTCGRGDLTGDGKVDVYAFAKLLSHWGKSKQSVCDGDINQDGVVNTQDLTTILNNWNPGN